MPPRSRWLLSLRAERPASISMGPNTTRAIKTLRTVAVARADDQGTDDGGGEPRATGRRPNGGGRIDDRAQQAVELPFGGKLLPPGLSEPGMHAVPTVPKRVKRGKRCELSAANGEPQAVAGHGVDEARRVPCEQKPVGDHATRKRINRERSKHCGAPDHAGLRKPVAQKRILGELAGEQGGRLSQHGVSTRRRLHQANVRQAVREGSHTDVSASPNVHFPERRGAAHALEIRSNSPTPRMPGMTQEAPAEGQR